MGERKYFLDWLRVIAFFLLILFHVGMLYVTWAYNLKSDRVSSDLEYAMNLLSPWRLALLFFISGVASRFLIAKLGAGGFAKDRVRRLLPVLLVGMFVTNVPQVYVEALSKGVFQGGYFAFWYGPYLHNGYFPYRMTPSWDHLWFLLYLFFYALIVALLVALRGRRDARPVGLGWLVVLPGLWLVGTNMQVSQLRPVTDAFFNDWANHLRWFGIYGTGLICAGQAPFWDMLRTHRRRFAAATGATLLLHVASNLYDAGPAWDGLLYDVGAGLYGWSAILTLCGYAAACLDRRSGALSYLNEAILPVYVFHQPVMLVFAYVIFPYRLPLMVEVPLIVGVTAAGSFLAYELFARRTRPLRFLFGLKPAPRVVAMPVLSGS